jgi:hypothetical protein
MPECVHTTKDNAGLELTEEDVTEADYIQEFGALVSLNYLIPIHKSIGKGSSSENEGNKLTGVDDGHFIGKRKPDGGNDYKKNSSKKIKSSKNFMMEDSLAAGKLIDMYSMELTQVGRSKSWWSN